jgi:hypothetical protein
VLGAQVVLGGEMPWRVRLSGTTAHAHVPEPKGRASNWCHVTPMILGEKGSGKAMTAVAAAGQMLGCGYSCQQRLARCETGALPAKHKEGYLRLSTADDRGRLTSSHGAGEDAVGDPARMHVRLVSVWLARCFWRGRHCVCRLVFLIRGGLVGERRAAG